MHPPMARRNHGGSALSARLDQRLGHSVLRVLRTWPACQLATPLDRLAPIEPVHSTRSLLEVAGLDPFYDLAEPHCATGFDECGVSAGVVEVEDLEVARHP